jgi:hypothetical protein
MIKMTQTSFGRRAGLFGDQEYKIEAYLGTLRQIPVQPPYLLCDMAHNRPDSFDSTLEVSIT